MAPRPKDIQSRFDHRFIPEPNSGCWLWTGGIGSDGYGIFGEIKSKWEGNAVFPGAHVVSYVLHHGPVPEGREVNHKCRVRLCVNPQHLEAATHLDNVRYSADAFRERGLRIRRSHCSRGHEMTDENVVLSGSRKERTCRECRKIRARRNYFLKRDARRRHELNMEHDDGKKFAPEPEGLHRE